MGINIFASGLKISLATFYSRVDEKDADIPKIVVHPISINDARKILVLIGGQPAPKEWVGGLNVTYNMGPELMKPGWKIKLEVHNENKIVPGHNVMGYIYGNEEPDRYTVQTKFLKKDFKLSLLYNHLELATLRFSKNE